MATPNQALRVIREQRELSMSALASRAGLTAATVSRIESGKRSASLRTLAALAQALEVDPELLWPKVEDVAS